MIDYRILHEMAEFEALVDLEIAIWGLNPRNAVPSALLHVMALNGGLVLGAFDGERMVGLLVSLAAQRGSESLLWSHMTGVHADYQRLGIGLELKRRQRAWALDHHYRAIRWTFDPLQRGNAWFNLHLLGQDAALSSHQYHINFYGTMDDAINRGLPSDRIEVCWQIDQPSRQPAPDLPAPLLICPDEAGLPLAQDSRWDHALYAVPVPTDLRTLRQEDPAAMLTWRMALRTALVRAFERGYEAVDFIKRDDRYMYILRKQETAA
jgi:predicted GNAT superfamily acetyltransferase